MDGKQLIHSPPKMVGYWRPPGYGREFEIRYMTPRRPNWFHRTMTRLMLGWEWHNVEP